MPHSLARNIAACSMFALLCAGTAQAADVEVLHYWTSGGEARSVAQLKKALAVRGVGWAVGFGSATEQLLA